MSKVFMVLIMGMTVFVPAYSQEGKKTADMSPEIIINKAVEEEIAPFTKDVENPDWSKIENNAVRKYGELGKEAVSAHMTVYFNEKQDWKNFATSYKTYFDRSVPGNRSLIHINNMSWPVFLHVSDSATLSTAISAMNFCINRFQPYDPAALDTYANLLHKMFLLYRRGNAQEALMWSDRATLLANNGEEYITARDKIKAGVPTWE